MEILGELPGRLTALAYAWRIPVGAATLVGAVVLLLVARRRGWHLVARRHPGRTLVAALLTLAVVAPVGWYLASPLFIRTQLVEPGPVGLPGPSAPAASGIATPGSADRSTGPLPSVEPRPSAAQPTPTAFATRVAAKGTFSGVDTFQFGSGTASLIETAPGSWTLRFDDFSVRNGPGLYVYLSPNAQGYDKAALEIGPLKATEGAFNYVLAAGVDLAAARSVIIWCKPFSALFAVAPLAAP